MEEDMTWAKIANIMIEVSTGRGRGRRKRAAGAAEWARALRET